MQYYEYKLKRKKRFFSMTSELQETKILFKHNDWNNNTEEKLKT